MSIDRSSPARFGRALHELDAAIVAFELVDREERSSSSSRTQSGDSVEHSSTGSRPQADDREEHRSSGSRTASGNGEPIVTDANHAFRDLFSPDMKRVIGLPLNELIVPASEQDEAAAFDRRTAAGKHTVAFVERTTTGGERTLCYCGIPTGVDHGLAVYTTVTSGREQALQSLVDLVADLAARPTTRVTVASVDRIRQFAASLRQSGRVGESVDD